MDHRVADLGVLQPHLCATYNPPRKPLAINFPETFFPQTNRCFSDARDLGQHQGQNVTLAKAHPEPSHLGSPASGWLHKEHRRARRYRSTGCGRTSPAAGRGRRRSGPVRLLGGLTGGMQSQPRPERWTTPPLPA